MSDRSLNASGELGRTGERATGELFAALLRAANEYAIIGTDPEGLITFFNIGAERLLGYRAEEVVGRLTPLTFHDPDEVAAHAAELGVPASFAVFAEPARRGEAVTREWTYVRKDGSRLTVSLNVAAMYDQTGALAGFVGIARDITAQKQVEAALERLRHQHELLLNSAGEGIIGCDRAGRVIFANPAAAGMTGYSVQELAGRPLHDIMRHSRPDGSPYSAQSCAISATLDAGAVHRVTGERFWRKDGTSFPVEYVSAPIRERGAISGAVVLFDDITERKRAEDEVRLLQTLLLAVSEVEGLPAALDATLRNVCEATGWPLGQAWVPRADGAGLECTGMWTAEPQRLAPFCLASRELLISPRSGMAGRAWSSKRVVWVRDTSTAPDFLRADAARSVGLKAGLAVPVLAGAEVVAVLEFFLFEPRDEDERLVRTVSAVAAQLGTLIERKRAEAEQKRLLHEVEAAEAKFRKLLESAPDAVVIIDGHGRIALVNRQAEAMFGYQQDELLGQPIEVLMPSRFAAAHAAYRADYFRKPRTRPMGAGLDIVARRKDGTEFPVEISLSPMATDGEIFVTSIIRDVTERKQAEAERTQLLARERAARQEAERLAAERTAILGRIADGVIVAGPSGNITFVNEAARRLLDLEDLDELPQHSTEVAARLCCQGTTVTPSDCPLARAALRGERVDEVELRIQRSDGTQTIAQGSALPVVAEDGTRLGAVLTLHDVTAQRDLERQKDEFFANISHDLRTPLTAIKASVGVVLANEPPGMPEPLHRMLVNIDLAAERMSTLVADLLELTRLQAGRVQLRLAHTDLRTVAIRAAQAIEPLAEARGQQLQLSLPPDPVGAVVDGERLERALLNLLSNAQKYGRAHGTIRLRLEHRPGEARFAVADDGPGIPKSELERIFDRFYRPESEATSAKQGSGLGLPIARAMIELHGGRVWAESTLGQGSTFWVSLPLAATGGEEWT